jgi:hypothetical protein
MRAFSCAVHQILGFPHDFIADMHTFVFGEAAEQVDHATTACAPPPPRET